MGARVSSRSPEEAASSAQDAATPSPQELVIPDDTFFGLDIVYDDFILEDTIGHGTYGKVYKAMYQGYRVAVKKLFLSNDPEERQEVLEDFNKETKILTMLKHKNIVRFFGTARTDPNYCLVFELCKGSVGSLLSSVKNGHLELTWQMVLKIAMDCAEAMVYLHGLTPKILHRDLKAENLLLDNDFTCKLTDFGLSRGFEAKSVMTICGTPCWVAPEIFKGEPYTETVDVYSYAVVLWELFCFNKPYADQDGVELPYLVVKENLRPPLLPHCPKSLNDLMEISWHADLNARPQFTTIMETLETIKSEMEPFIKQKVDPTQTSPPDVN